MRIKKWIAIGATAIAVAGMTAWAVVASMQMTFRTTAVFEGVVQGQANGLPQIDFLQLNGHRLVNLAMGRSINDTNFPSQVLAMEFDCNLSAMSLVVFDRDGTNIVATIAHSTSVDFVKEQKDATKVAPNRARFVAQFQVDKNGVLLNGFLTVAGRLHLNPNDAANCPRAVLIALDKDRDDRLFGDSDIKDKDDPDDSRLALRVGEAHLIGVIDIDNDGTPMTVLVPFGRLSIRRPLLATAVL